MYENNIKLAVLGGDLRQVSVARKLSGLGFETAVWGMMESKSGIDDAVRCNKWEDAVRGSKAVILPVPASSDGVFVNCCGCPGETENQLELNTLINSLEKGTFVLGGRFTPLFMNFAGSKEIKVRDYFNSEELQIKNAVPTAEGALAIAMNELPVTVHGSVAAVIGYGRVGRMLSEMLGALGAKVTVAARKSTDLAWASNRGFGTLRIELSNGVSSLSALGDGYDVIFNTVPYWLFDSKVLSRMSRNTLIIDVASAPGGVDLHTAAEYGVNVIWALSLPGKYSPYTAGNIICDSILDILEKEEVIK